MQDCVQSGLEAAQTDAALSSRRRGRYLLLTDVLIGEYEYFELKRPIFTVGFRDCDWVLPKPERFGILLDASALGDYPRFIVTEDGEDTWNVTCAEETDFILPHLSVDSSGNGDTVDVENTDYDREGFRIGDAFSFMWLGRANSSGFHAFHVEQLHFRFVEASPTESEQGDKDTSTGPCLPSFIIGEIASFLDPTFVSHHMAVASPLLLASLFGEVAWPYLQIDDCSDSLRKMQLVSVSALKSVRVLANRFSFDPQLFARSFARNFAGKNLHTLVLCGAEYFEENGIALPPNLRSLTLNFDTLREIWPSLLFCKIPRTIQRLKIAPGTDDTTLPPAEILGGAPNLQALSFTYGPPQSFWDEANPATLGQLTELDVGVCQKNSVVPLAKTGKIEKLGLGGLHHSVRVWERVQLRNLTTLAIRNRYFLEERAFVKFLSQLLNLKNLFFEDCLRSSSAFVLLVEAAPNLEHLEGKNMFSFCFGGIAFALKELSSLKRCKIGHVFLSRTDLVVFESLKASLHLGGVLKLEEIPGTDSYMIEFRAEGSSSVCQPRPPFWW